MKKLKTIFFFLFLLILIQQIIAVPVLPMIIEGSVKINNRVAPKDTVITAKIDGVEIEKTTILEPGKYNLLIEEVEENSVIDLYVNNINTDNNVTWASGKILKLDLAVTDNSITGFSIKNLTKPTSIGILITLTIVIIGLIIYFSLAKPKNKK